MRKISFQIAVFLILIMFGSHLTAQNLVIRLNGGIENIEALNSIQKLYFSGNDLVVDFISGLDDVYAISVLQKLYFDSTVATEDNPEINDRSLSVYPNPAVNFIVVQGIPAYSGNLSIYRMDGGLVLETEVTTDKEIIDIKGLHPGLYLVNVPGFTTKFIKK